MFFATTVLRAILLEQMLLYIIYGTIITTKSL